MKSIRSFILIAIGMIALTATAHTAKLEQKQKAELVKGFTTEINAVSVNDYQVAPVLTDVAKANDIDVLQFKNVTDPGTYLAIITDVGWRSSKQRFTNIPYKEKLLGNSKNDLKFCKNQKQNRIRENPFAVNQSFIFKRYC